MTTGRKTWKEFQQTGLLWWVNRILHTFGWAITLVEENDGTISDAYPARCTYRGFTEEAEEKGFKKVAAYLLEEAELLKQEVDAP